MDEHRGRGNGSHGDEGVRHAIDTSAAGRETVAAAGCSTANANLVFVATVAADGGILAFIVTGHGREV